MDEIQEKPLMQRLKEMEQVVNPNAINNKKVKVRELKLPRKAKVRARRAKKGWIGILTIDKAKGIYAEKQRVEGSTVKLKDGSYHGLEEFDVYYWQGKYPIIIQPKEKNVPWSPLIIEKDETYGQPYIKARMLKDVIKEKGSGGFSKLIWLIVIAGVAYGGAKMFGFI